MSLYDIGLIIFGAILTWVYTALTDFRKTREARKTLLLSLHQEIKQIRAAIIIPTYQSNTLHSWPYINSVMVKNVMQSNFLCPNKDRAIIGLMVILIKHIEEYTNYHFTTHMMIANSLEKHCYEANHKSMYEGLLKSLLSTISILKMVDTELSKMTKLPILEDELNDTIHTLSNQTPPQSQNTTSA